MYLNASRSFFLRDEESAKIFAAQDSYSVGDLISISDQNLTKQTCYPGNGYAANDNWKLSDWNGAVNGGNYNVI